MLPPMDPDTGVAEGWVCKWTGSGGKFLIDVFVGNTAVPASLSLAALTGMPAFDAEDEVSPAALAAVELAAAQGTSTVTSSSNHTITSYTTSTGVASGYWTTSGTRAGPATDVVQKYFAADGHVITHTSGGAIGGSYSNARVPNSTGDQSTYAGTLVAHGGLVGVEFSESPGGVYFRHFTSVPGSIVGASGYQRGTLALPSFGAAFSWDASKGTSGAEVSFGANSGGAAWPEVTHIALMNGSTVLGVASLTLPVINPQGSYLRIPAGQFRFLASTYSTGEA